MSTIAEKAKKSILYLFSDRALAFLGVFFVSSSLFVPLLYSANLRIPLLPELLAYFGLMLVGYFLQGLWCKIIKYERVSQSISYESLEKSYRFRMALPVIGLGVLAGFLVVPSVDAYLAHLSRTVEYYYYDENSFIPYLVTVFIAAGVFFGSFAWFFHAERILTGRAAIVCLIVLAVAIFLSLNVGAVGFQSVCVIGFTCCWMFALNRQALQRTLASDKAPHPAANVTWYNTAFTAVLLLAVLALLGLFYVVFTGLKSLFLLVIGTILSAGEGQDGWSMERDEIAAGVNRMAFGEDQAAASPSFWFMIITVVLVALFLVAFIARRTNPVQSLLEKFYAFLKFLVAFLIGPIQYFLTVDTGKDDEGYVFLDEEEKLKQRAFIRGDGTRAVRTWADFQSEYRAKKTPEDRYRYAYAEYVSIMRQNHSSLKGSDTPRETGGKLASYTDVPETKREVQLVTDGFERTDFACLPADATVEEATKVLLREIKHYLR